jgi:hypothetical protein
MCCFRLKKYLYVQLLKKQTTFYLSKNDQGHTNQWGIIGQDIGGRIVNKKVRVIFFKYPTFLTFILIIFKLLPLFLAQEIILFQPTSNHATISASIKAPHRYADKVIATQR